MPVGSTPTNGTCRFYPDQSFTSCAWRFYPDQLHLAVSPDQLFFLCPAVLPRPIAPGGSIPTSSLFLYLEVLTRPVLQFLRLAVLPHLACCWRFFPTSSLQTWLGRLTLTNLVIYCELGSSTPTSFFILTLGSFTLTSSLYCLILQNFQATLLFQTPFNPHRLVFTSGYNGRSYGK